MNIAVRGQGRKAEYRREGARPQGRMNIAVRGQGRKAEHRHEGARLQGRMNIAVRGQGRKAEYCREGARPQGQMNITAVVQLDIAKRYCRIKQQSTKQQSGNRGGESINFMEHHLEMKG